MELCEQFGRAGFLEHVFHLPNALRSLFRMLRAGGRIVHSAPSGNLFNHGFYMSQPTVFLDFFAANDWTVNLIQVVQYTPNQEKEPAFFTNYTPGLLRAVSYGKRDNKLYGTICIVTKNAESTGDRIPQQGFYARMHGLSSPGGTTRALDLSSMLRRLVVGVLNRLSR